MLYLELKHFLTDHNLNYTDKASMAAGIEVRVPLIDKELVQFATRIPSHYKQVKNQGKAVFKKAMEPFLPKEVIYRPKTGFGAPLRKWLHDDLKLITDTYLSKKSIEHRGIFDFESLQKTIRLDHAGKIDATYTIFAALCIEMWCRQFIDTQIPSIITI